MTNLKKSNTPTYGRKMSVQNWLLSGASALALASVAMPAYAQSAAATDDTVETVVVTGIKNSLATAQATKQNSDQFVDSISAVDIGALPDRTVAEALQRVPGVTLQRTDANRDPSRYVSEPNTVFIRGLSWVQSETNGRDIFSAANGRSLSFADVSADLLSGVDVYKNPDAEMIEGGIGGTVDLRTRKPFDQDGELLAGSVNVDYADLKQKGTPSINGLYSNRWETGMGEIGFLISVDYQDEVNRVNEFSTDPNQCVDGVDAVDAPACATNPARVFIPNVFDTRQIDWEQKRLAASAVFQWRPNDQWEITVDALHADADPKDKEYNAPFDLPQTNTNSTYKYGAQDQFIAGTISNADFENIDTRVGVHHDRTGDYSLNVKFNPDDHWSFSADAQYVESEATNYSMTALINLEAPFTAPTGFADDPAVAETVKLNIGNNSPTINISNTSAIANQGNYYWEAAMDHLEDNYAHSFAYRADASYKFHDDEGLGWFKSIDVGYRGTDKQAVTRQTGYNWSLLSAASWGGSGGSAVFLNQTGFTGCGPGQFGFPPPNFSLTCVTPTAHTDSALPTLSSQRSFGSFFNQTIPSFFYVNPSFLFSGTTNIYNHLKNTETNSFGWTPINVQAGCPTKTFCLGEFAPNISSPKADNISGGVNNQLEKVKSGYMQVNFAHDSFLGIDKPIDGNIGVRIIDTEETQTAPPLTISGLTSCTPQPVPPTLATDPPLKNCTDYNSALRFEQNATGGLGPQLISEQGAPGGVFHQDYVRVLPSFNLRMHITDELQARFAMSKAMVRPDFTQTNGFANLSFNFGASTNLNAAGLAPSPDLSGTFATPGLTGTGGNPFLKPLDATQFDGSLEYYFAPTGNLTLSVFHKDIKNYIFSTVGPETFINAANGSTETFEVTRPQNGKKGTVEGFEVGYTQFFDGLPDALGLPLAFGGFGVNANYTKIYSSGGSNEAQNFFDAPEVANAGAPLPLEGMSPDSYNVALLYEKYGFSGRLAYNWRSDYLLTTSSVSGQPVWSENYGQLDASILYNFWEHYKVGLQVTNLLGAKTLLDIGFAAFHPRYEWIATDRKFGLVLRASF
jgi:TonB-dependent receptor